MNNATIPYVTRNLRHLLAAPNLTETQRTIITRTLATLSEEFPNSSGIYAEMSPALHLIHDYIERYAGAAQESEEIDPYEAIEHLKEIRTALEAERPSIDDMLADNGFMQDVYEAMTLNGYWNQRKGGR